MQSLNVDPETTALDEEQLAFCKGVHQPLVASLALFCGRADVANELAQEALARACARWGYVRTLDRPKAWVYRVGFNLARSWGRRRAAERRAHQRLIAQPPPPPTADHAEALAVRAALLQLTLRQRAAVVLRYYDDLPISHVAELMGCAPGTVQSLTAKGLARLRSLLTEPDPSPESQEALRNAH